MKKVPLKIYLAGQWNEHDHNWKRQFVDSSDFKFHDPERDSDQTSPETFFLDDLKGVKSADIMIANPYKSKFGSFFLEAQKGAKNGFI